MKAIVVTSAFVLCAAVASAQEPVTNPATTPAPKLIPVAQPVQHDSPLVAAAKRTGRLGKKPSVVITNETLAKTGGHFTTTKSQDANALPTTPDPSKQPLSTGTGPAPGTQQAPPAAAPNKAEAKKPSAKAARNAAAAYEGDSVDTVTDDPAVQEGVMSGSGAQRPAAPQKPGAPRPPSI